MTPEELEILGEFIGKTLLDAREEAQTAPIEPSRVDVQVAAPIVENQVDMASVAEALGKFDTEALVEAINRVSGEPVDLKGVEHAVDSLATHIAGQTDSLVSMQTAGLQAVQANSEAILALQERFMMALGSLADGISSRMQGIELAQRQLMEMSFADREIIVDDNGEAVGIRIVQPEMN